ncbi:type II secretion system protein [bacterium]|nr:type II secretion system protein [bacterium]
MAKSATITALSAGVGAKSSRHKHYPKLLAFTLAEVLITLGIIGVVAAMTIPTLMVNVQLAELQTAYKKVYSDLNQAAQHFQADYDIAVPDYTYWNADNAGMQNAINFQTNIFWTYFKKSAVQERKTTIKPLSPKYSSTVMNYCDYSSNFVDINGRFIRFDDDNANGENGPKICVDTNGDKPPNRQGWDNFLFLFTTDGKVIPIGQSHINNPVNKTQANRNFSVDAVGNCKVSANIIQNASCSYYALLDQSPDDSSKSYWHDFLPSLKN